MMGMAWVRALVSGGQWGREKTGLRGEGRVYKNAAVTAVQNLTCMLMSCGEMFRWLGEARL